MSSSHLLTSGTTLLALVAAALLLMACGDIPGQLPPQLSGPPRVGVPDVQTQRAALDTESTGRAAP